MSPDSQLIDHVIKKAEYAAAGVTRYWIVDGDKANSVHMFRLVDGAYELEREPAPLTWLINEPATSFD